MKTPIYTTGVEAVKLSRFSCGTCWEAVSQYGYYLQGEFESEEAAAAWVIAAVFERRKKWEAAGRNLDDAPAFKTI